MADFYEILGLDRSADATQIRMAYKRLAMQYHPDRNAGDREAEEIFKQINEAYHVLSDSLKKARYDSAMYADNPEGIAAELAQREQQRRRYYKMRHAQQKEYKIDGNYFKVQALAFVAFFVMAGVCFGIAHLVSYFFQQHQLAEVRKLNAKVHEVNALFNTGKIEEAFKTLGFLHDESPFEVRFVVAHDSLIGALRVKAENHYAAREYAPAVTNFLLLKKLEEPQRKETLYMISRCQFYLGNYAESMTALKQLHSQDPRNLQLIYSIATLHHEYLSEPEQALQYFSMGKKLFRENMTEIYGQAFEMSLNPKDAPDIYYDMYAGSARVNIELKNFADAVVDSDIAIYLRRETAEPYGLKMAACEGNRDFERLCETVPLAKKYGELSADTYRRKYCR